MFLSQNEIIAIAEDDAQQLQFIDRFFDFHGFRARIAAIEKELYRLDKIMGDGLRAFAEHEEVSGKLATLDKELAKLDDALKNPIFESYRTLEQKHKALTDQREFLFDVGQSIAKAQQALLSRTAPTIPVVLKHDPALLRNLDLIGKTQQAIAKSLSSLSRQLETNRVTADKELKDWYPSYEAAQKDYENYVQKMGGDYKGIALDRERLLKQRAPLQTQLSHLAAMKDEVKPTSKRRDELLDDLQAEYTNYTAERKAKCEKFMQELSRKTSSPNSRSV